MTNKPKPDDVTSYITGKDLRVMRIHSQYSTSVMAEFMGKKSRKTIENWEQGNSQPSINQFIIFCHFTGFKPDLVIKEIMKRNEKDQKQITYFDLEACLA